MGKDNKKQNKQQIKPLIENKVVAIEINKKMTVYFDEWYLEELVDLVKQYPGEKYQQLIKTMIVNSKQQPTFPQSNLASHKIIEKKTNFFEFHSMEEYINETWLNSEKISLLKVSSAKKMHVKFSTVGSIPHIPNYLNSWTPNNMLSFFKQKSIIFKKITILFNVNGKMHWKDYKTIVRDFFKVYDFESLSMGSIAKTTENGIDYYRISIIKIRNGVDVNSQGLMVESIDFLRRIIFMIYEINPTLQNWNGYGNSVFNKEMEKLKMIEPYFKTILEKYLNPSLIMVE